MPIEKIVCPLLNPTDTVNIAIVEFQGISPCNIMCLEYNSKTKKCSKRNADYHGLGETGCIYSKWEKF